MTMNKALKPLLSSPQGPRRNVESKDLRAFRISEAATLDRQGASANGPAWAAPKNTSPGLANQHHWALQGAYGSGRPAKTVNDSSKAEDRAVGTYRVWSQHLKSSEFDKVMSVSGSGIEIGGGSANPCYGSPMENRYRRTNK